MLRFKSKNNPLIARGFEFFVPDGISVCKTIENITKDNPT